MKLYSEFVVMHPDEPMPDEETLCPSFWTAGDFDADGDYYADALAGRWTYLRLKKTTSDSVLWVHGLKQNMSFTPGRQEAVDLQRYLEYQRAGRYDDQPTLAELPSLAVTLLAIETSDLADYREFLETVAGFIGSMRGMLVSPWELDEAEFRAEFLREG